MIITIFKSHNGLPITVDTKTDNKITIMANNDLLKQGDDYIIQNEDDKNIIEIFFKWMNQSIFVK